MAEHLAANKVNLDKTPVTLGMVLKMNQGGEQFIEAKKANYLLARRPREPFVIRMT